MRLVSRERGEDGDEKGEERCKKGEDYVMQNCTLNSFVFTGCLAGLDIVEINPRVGTKEDASRTIELAIKITEAFFGKVYHHELAKLEAQVSCAKGKQL